MTPNFRETPSFGDTGAVPLISTCLCLVTRVTRAGERQVLLGHKKTGLGQGKIVALGGHVEPGESPAEAAIREVKEESGIEVDGLAPAAHITFRFPARPAWDMTASVFLAGEFSGEPAETGEIRPEWFGRAELPLDRMWDDARQWLPRVLDGERLRATFGYAADCQTVATARISRA